MPHRPNLDATAYATDKSEGYLRTYERYFAPMRDQPIALLELGVDHGGSLRLWRDYFTCGRIVGLDSRPVALDDADRIHVYQGPQDDTALLDRIAREQAPDGFDVIIDDASHLAAPTRVAFWHLFLRHLRPRGVYAIEDWGTGYWDSWEDGERFAGHLWQLDAWPRPPATRQTEHGRVHAAGMVGLIKELVDECAMSDITKRGVGVGDCRSALIEHLHVSHGQVIVVKAAQE